MNANKLANLGNRQTSGMLAALPVADAVVVESIHASPMQYPGCLVPEAPKVSISLMETCIDKLFYAIVLCEIVNRTSGCTNSFLISS